MLEEFRAATKPAQNGVEPYDVRYLVAPSGAAVEVKFAIAAHGFKTTGKDKLIIERLVARVPGQGDGSFAMARIAALADAHSVHLAMFMNPIAHKAMDMDDLIKWSKKHGFEEYGLPQGLFWREPGATPAAPPEPKLG